MDYDFSHKQIMNTEIYLDEHFFQETFKRVHEKAHTFRGDRLKPWLLTIATRIALDGFRKNKRLKAVSLNQRYDYTNDGCGQMVTVAIEDHTHDPLDEALT